MDKFSILTSEGHLIEGDNMFDIISQLPLFNNYVANNQDDLIKYVTEDLNIDETLIEVIKSGDILSLKGINIDENIWIKEAYVSTKKSLNDMFEENYVVFVYGTLKKNFQNCHYLNGAKFLGKAITVNKYSMIEAKQYYFPILFKDNELNISTDLIEGELYRVNKDTLDNLDYLENGLYEREKVEILRLENENIYNAFTYFWTYDIKDLKEITSITNFVEDSI